MKKSIIGLIFTLQFLLFNLSFAHWSDLSTAEIITQANETQIVLTFPTGLVADMDSDGDQILSEEEIRLHKAELTTFFAANIILSDHQGQKPNFSLFAITNAALPPDLGIAPGTHSTLKLIYTWMQEPQSITINYNLFLPGIPTASCLATILQDGQTQTFVFTPENQTLILEQGTKLFLATG